MSFQGDRERSEDRDQDQEGSEHNPTGQQKRDEKDRQNKEGPKKRTSM